MARLSDDMHVYIHRDDTLKDILFDITARLERIEAEVGIGPTEGIEKIDVGEYMRDMNKRLGECEQALLPPNLRCPEDKKPESANDLMQWLDKHNMPDTMLNDLRIRAHKVMAEARGQKHAYESGGQ